MFCPVCGNNISESHKFCAVCGKSVESIKEQMIQQSNANPNPNMVPKEPLVYQSPTPKKPPVKAAAAGAEGSKATLIILFTVLGVAVAGLLVAIVVLLFKLDIIHMPSKTGAKNKSKKESIIYDEDAPAETVEDESDDAEVDVEKEYVIAEGNEADYSNPQVADSSKYNYYSSGIKDFGFAYPASLFNSEYKSFDQVEGHYGTVIQEIHYSGSDGSFLNFVLSERTDGSSIDGMLVNASAFEKSFISDPKELVYEIKDSYGEVAYRGYTDSSHSAETFNMTKVDGDYVMQMKIYYPAPTNDADASAKEYYLKSMYQLCDFGKANIPSMSDGVVASYDEEEFYDDESQYEVSESVAGIDTTYGGTEYGWSQAYFDYMQALDGEDEYWNAGLIYVNNDDIPELVLEGNCEAVGYLILTYKNGKIDELYTNRLSFDYIERGNILRNAGGHMGYCYENVYTIENGRWKQILSVDGDENMPLTKYDDIFNRAYENGTVGDISCNEVYESMVDYLLYIDG